MPEFHRTAPRGAEFAPRSFSVEGRYGRMFRNLPAFAPGDDALAALAATMSEPEADDGSFNGPIPAGYTYLGQFIDHDITFDPASSLQRLQDPEGLTNFRTPRFDLDSLYGKGPHNDPFLYDPTIDGGFTSMLIGKNEEDELDLPRNSLLPKGELPQGRALIGDPRNDENVIVSQLQLLFLRFHNKVVESVRGQMPSASADELFEEAQRQVRWHYQWIVIHDFLRQIAGNDVVTSLLGERADITDPLVEASMADFQVQSGPAAIHSPTLRFFHWHDEPFMPVEFSVAAYRFGHSMIRPAYFVNSVAPLIPIFTAGDLTEPHGDLRGFRPLPTKWTVDWSFFFEIGGDNLQRARKIDAHLAPPLQDVPGTNEPHALALRNLRRGAKLMLPSGQRVARAMGLTPLTDQQLAISDLSQEFVESAPLWFYILKEAELGGGEHLGDVGGRLVAEVLVGLLDGDPTSYLSVEPNWKPTLPAQVSGDFTVPDLIRFTLGTQTTPSSGQSWQS